MIFRCFAFRFCCVSIFHVKIQFSCIQISEEENHLKRIHRAVAVGKPAAIFMPKERRTIWSYESQSSRKHKYADWQSCGAPILWKETVCCWTGWRNVPVYSFCARAASTAATF